MRLIAPIAVAVIAFCGIAIAQKTAPDAIPGGVYNVTPPSLSNFQTAPNQMDSAANLKVDCVVGCSGSAASVTVTQGTVPWTVAGTVTATQGTSPTTVLLTAGGAVAGIVTATQGTTPWTLAEGCGGQALSTTTFTPINVATSTQIITGASSKQTYICHFEIVAGAATNVALVEGTASLCATGTGGLDGGTTAATGLNLAANGGVVEGMGRYVISKTVTAADNVCLLLSAANQVSGKIVWVQF